MNIRKKRDQSTGSRKPSKVLIREKTPQSYRLSPAQIAAAREVLGAPSATATIEMALDMVIFREELLGGTRAMRGVEIARYDD